MSYTRFARVTRPGNALRVVLCAGAASALWGSAIAGSAWEGRSYSNTLEDRLGHSCEAGRVGAFGAHRHEADLRFDEATGRNTRSYPPDRRADHKRMSLKIDIPDMNTPRFEAVQRLTFAPISAPLETLTLNAYELDIQRVEMGGRALPFSYDGERLSISFNPPLPAGQDATIVTTYTCTAPVDGLFWLTEDNGLPGRPAQIHTQGQPETNRFWFPGHDSPNERLATELIVTVPDGFLVSSNGELRDESVREGRRTFHWALDEEHPMYLVSLIVGKFDVADVSRASDSVPMPVYVPPGEGGKIRATYGNTSRMLETFERVFDEPYPWPRYAQLVVWNFGAGGMENTSATTMYDTAILDDIAIEDADIEPLIAHELAHQWFGDYLTCNSWEHIWLNEGFATYLESIWFEERDGYDTGYLWDCWVNMRGVARGDRVPARDAMARPGMVSNLYAHPDEVFRKASNPYPKGASTLHMLRQKLGDEAFFGGIRSYIDEHRLGTVRTHHLQEHLERASGLDLQRFFEQWTVRPGTPQVTTDVKWDESAKALRIVVEQTQPISAEAPAFAFDLPVRISEGDEWRTVTIPVTGKRHETTVPLAGDPKMVCVDPDLHVLMTPTVKQPRSRFIAQLREGPTVPSRLDAAVMLEDHPGRDTTAALLACVGDTSEFHAVRSRAAETLGRLGKAEELMRLLEGGVDHPRVRREVVDALASTREKSALAVLEKVAANDRSYAVRSAAIRGLGTLGGEAQVPIVMSFIDTPSQHDQIRQAALAALADLDSESGLEAAIRYTGPGHYQRTRAAALSAIADLSDHDAEKAYDAVAPLLFDPVERVRNAAAFALVRIDDERGVELFRRAAKSHPHPSFRESASGWANRLSGRLAGDDVEALQEEIGELRERLDALERARDRSER